MTVIEFIEKKYKCSGMCTPALFYLTQSVEEGLPEIGCLQPVIKDVTDLMYDLGATIMASGILFLIMIFFLCPICCYKKTKNLQ